MHWCSSMLKQSILTQKYTDILAGEIKIIEDLSGHTTVGYDVYITVSDGRNTVGPSTLTITLAGRWYNLIIIIC